MWPLRLRLLSSRRGLLRSADLFLCPTDNYGGSPLRGATQLHRAAHIRHSTKSLCQRNGSMPVRLWTRAFVQSRAVLWWGGLRDGTRRLRRLCARSLSETLSRPLRCDASALLRAVLRTAPLPKVLPIIRLSEPPLPERLIGLGRDRRARRSFFLRLGCCSVDVASWPFASIRGDAAILLFSEKSRHRLSHAHRIGFMSTRPFY